MNFAVGVDVEPLGAAAPLAALAPEAAVGLVRAIGNVADVGGHGLCVEALVVCGERTVPHLYMACTVITHRTKKCALLSAIYELD